MGFIIPPGFAIPQGFVISTSRIPSSGSPGEPPRFVSDKGCSFPTLGRGSYRAGSWGSAPDPVHGGVRGNAPPAGFGAEPAAPLPPPSGYATVVNSRTGIIDVSIEQCHIKALELLE